MAKNLPSDGHFGTTTSDQSTDHSEIVITGIAGRFPESDSIDELRENLFAAKDFTTVDDRRWPPGIWGTPARSAKLKTIDQFDNEYFGVSDEDADFMDHQIRIFLECVAEAIIDSGRVGLK